MTISHRANKDRFSNTIATVALLTLQFEAISDCRQRKSSQPVNQNKHGRKSCSDTTKVNSRLLEARDGFRGK